MRGLGLWLALVVVLSRAAYAEDVKDAKAHYEKATGAFALGNYAEAAVEYEAAFKSRQEPALLYNAAQAHRLGGNKPRALQLYQNYVRLYGDRISNRDEVKRHIAALKIAIETDRSATTAPPNGPQAVAPDSRPVASDPTPVEAKPALIDVAQPAQRPVHKRAWFWGVVGGAAAVVILGVGLGVGLGLRKSGDPSFGSIEVN